MQHFTQSVNMSIAIQIGIRIKPFEAGEEGHTTIFLFIYLCRTERHPITLIFYRCSIFL